MKKELTDLKTNANWEKQKKVGELSILNDKLKAKDIEIENIKKDLETYQGKANWLRKVNKKNEEEITKLSNQVKVLKKALNK